jgi:hypothetical protein
MKITGTGPSGGPSVPGGTPRRPQKRQKAVTPGADHVHGSLTQSMRYLAIGRHHPPRRPMSGRTRAHLMGTADRRHPGLSHFPKLTVNSSGLRRLITTQHGGLSSSLIRHRTAASGNIRVGEYDQLTDGHGCRRTGVGRLGKRADKRRPSLRRIGRAANTRRSPAVSAPMSRVSAAQRSAQPAKPPALRRRGAHPAGRP